MFIQKLWSEHQHAVQKKWGASVIDVKWLLLNSFCRTSMPSKVPIRPWRKDSAMYVYKMVQVPPNIEVKANKHRGNEAAVYLETVVNDYASEGWEFYRIDSIGVSVKAGCFDALKGHKDSMASYYVISFRKPKWFLGFQFAQFSSISILGLVDLETPAGMSQAAQITHC